MFLISNDIPSKPFELFIFSRSLILKDSLAVVYPFLVFLFQRTFTY